MENSKTRMALAILALLGIAAPLCAQTSLISTGSVWKYLDDGSDQGTVWTGVAFGDSTWKSGPAELGFGDGGEATTNASGFITYYYRHAFNVADASSITNLRVLLKRDDGAIGYLNGVEVFRDNMPEGPVAFDAGAATTASDDGQDFWPHSFSSSALVTGNNVFAVEVHQVNLASSDISFDLSLEANPRPSISISSPTNGQIIAANTIVVSGTALPAGLNVTLVELFDSGTKVGESTNANFSIAWQNPPLGFHIITARITDSSQLVADSADVTFQVQAPPATLLVPRGSSWKFNNSNTDLGTAWIDPAYDDSSWGGPLPGPLGDNNEVGVQRCTSVINIGPTGAKFPVIYYRRTFNVSGAAAYQSLFLRLNRDDAAVVFLNGIKIKNDGVPEPLTFAYTQGAEAAGQDEVTYFETIIPATALVDGPNVLAVANYQANSGSSDLQFDLELEGVIDTSPPTVIDTQPAPESLVFDLSFITFEFDSDVTGVNASDLLINSEPATNILVISPRQYTFYFPRPATGTVHVAWSPNAGITDTTPLHNAFVPDPEWSYVFNPNAPHIAIISEFMADNTAGIKDEDGSRQDWIEIFNPGLIEQNVAGWFLTDDPTNLTKWTFPAVVLQPNSYTIVWASSKDRRDPARPLHTNFKLTSNAGGYLALSDPTTNIVSEFTNYPAQQSNVSYGRDRLDSSIVGFFTVPTPGAQNKTEGAGFMSPPIFSFDSGIYTNDSFIVTITGPADGVIRYSVDGNAPTNNSPIYSSPITVSGNMVIKARVYPSGATTLFPSPVVARSYILLDPSVKDFNSNLPLMVINSTSTILQGIPGGQPRIPGSLVVIDTEGGRTTLRSTPQLHELAEYEIVGQTSAGFPKLPYRIEVQDELRNQKAVSILGLPADGDWRLRNPYSDKCQMNDFLGYELFDQMGNYSCRRRFVEVFVHQGAGKVVASDYSGVEVLFEVIAISGHRVDIAKLTPAITNEPNISGGYIFKKDKDSVGDLNFSTVGANGSAGQALKFHDPKPRELNPQQIAWLPQFLNQMEAALYGNNWLIATGTNHYSNYLDVDSFVEQFWIVEFTKQIDGYRLSDYFSKDRNGKVKPVPIWDWNLSFGNANYLDGGNYRNWYYTELGAGDHPWAWRLIADPDFSQKVADRWAVLRTNIFSSARLLARIDEIAALLSEASDRDFARFPRLSPSISTWPNPNGAAGGWDVDYVNPTNYAGIISEMKKWVNGRYLWTDSLFSPVPTFSQPGGIVANGTTIALSGPAGAAIYYTLDGTDPRAPGGNNAPSALLYSSPITVGANMLITARVKQTATSWQNTWGAPASASYATALPNLRITEIMYHPGNAPAGNTNDPSNFEFIEVQNIGGTPLNVNRFQLGAGVQFQFPNVLLAAGQYAVIVKDTNAFQSLYGTGPLILGTFSGSLNNAGDHLVLSGPVRETILDFSFKDGWYPATDGVGFSLVIVNANAAPNTWGLAASWRASAAAGGSPGAVDPAAPARPGIVVNEIRTFSDPTVDGIELYNPTASDVNIGGWFLSDDFGTPTKFVIPPGTIIPAHGFRTFTELDFNPNPVDPNSFALSSKGDDVYLFSGNGVDLTGYVHGFNFGASEAGVTFGRYVTSTGNEDFVRQTSDTFGVVNGGPRVGPVVISEINYHPVDVFVGGTNALDNATDEFIELQNITATPVDLFDPTHPSNTWHLRSGVDYDFPMNVTIPAGGSVLVVGFDPLLDPTSLNGFRQRMSVPQSVPIYGPWSGILQNDSEKIELHMPRIPDTNGTYVLVEKVEYSDSSPWPSGADGLGLSLQRIVASAYGNDPINWVAGAPSPGANYIGGTAPVITSQPGGQTVIVGADLTVGVTATGPDLHYQWRKSGVPVATNATLTITNFQVGDSGTYSVMVYNGAGYALGTNFYLGSRIHVVGQPQSHTNVLTGTTTNFVVSPVGNGTIFYQWYFNGGPISPAVNPSAVTPTLTLTNVQLTFAGIYYCRVTDDFDSVNSDPATLQVVAKPVILVQPISITAVEGGSATFSFGVSGTTPMIYRWRINTNNGPNLVAATQIIPSTNSFFTLSNLPYSTNVYRVSVASSNIAGAAPISTLAVLTVLKDSDRDGLPDIWEIGHTGFSTNNATDGTRDDDGDGMSNAAEYIAGTDYTNALSVLKLTATLANPTTLQFNAVSNHTYTIQYSDTLNPATWRKLGDVLARTTTRNESMQDTDAKTNRFYRVVTPIQLP